MKTILRILAIGFLVTMTASCLEENITPLTDLETVYGEATSLSNDKIKEKSDKQSKITGFVQIEWKGGNGGDKGNQPDEMLAFAGFDGFEATDRDPVKGSFVYQVTKPDLTVHREITATLTGVVFAEEKGKLKAFMIGEVISDTKGCAGNGHGGHDSGCQGGSCGGHDPGGHDGGCSGDDGSDHTDGGCSGTDHTDGGCSDSDHTDGGCSDSDHTDGGCTDTDHTDGGCSNPDHTDTDHTDGGCSDSDHTDGGCSDSDHTDGGCSGSDHTGGSPGDHGSGGDSGMGNPLKGKNCRVGQIIAIKGHDGGTPGVTGDGITWKWFSSEGSFVPSIFNTAEWPHLCKKTILEGNIKIHIP